MKLTRLFIYQENIIKDSSIEIKNNDFDYLIKVMRLKINDEILIFNGIDGEFQAQITQINKKDCLVKIISKTKEQNISSNITLAFAPVKNVRIDFVAAKATEMGVNKFQPIMTNHSVIDKINQKRFLANIKEACEQCERIDIPELLPIVKLNKYLNNLNEKQILILCDESIKNNNANEVLNKIDFKNTPEIIVFIGPEGGFSKKEFECFYQLKNINRISLGNRILRSDTAIISALAIIGQFI
jgi:16S rRNA (uracil1498-N3)-methyltransferase